MRKYINLCAVLILIGVAACGGNDDSESGIVKETKVEGDGRVICYNDDGTEFFNRIGSYVHAYSSGFTVFKYLKSDPDYKPGYTKFSPSWKCIIEDW